MFRTHFTNGNRPRMVLTYTDSAHAARCGRYFRRLGWEVHLVASAAEARRLSSSLSPSVVVLNAEEVILDQCLAHVS
jgi:hypothetical protein